MQTQTLLTFDLNDENSTDNFIIPQQHKVVVNPGLMDGVCIYFNVIFDDEISFDSSPLNKKSSWGNRFFRTEKRFLNEGEAIVFDLKMKSYQRPGTWQLVFPDQAVSVQTGQNHYAAGFPAALRGAL